jgi:Leucine-rich repeat (LRR) protein
MLAECGLKDLNVSVFGGVGKDLINLKKIDLTKNYLTIIRNLSFSRAKYLKTLNISQNQISTLENTAFHHLDQLEQLIISNNKLTVVAWVIFEENKYLKWLDISRNNIRKIVNNNRNYLSIKHFDIYNNFLEDVSIVRNLLNIEILNLSRNPRMKYQSSTFNNNPKMKILYLTSTNLEQTVNFDFLKSMTKIVYLNIMENNLENKIDSLPELPELTKLIMRNCSLTTFDYIKIKEKFPKLTKINLSENLFGCSSLQEMLTFLSGQRIELNQDFSKVIPDFDNISDVECVNNSVTNFLYLQSQNQQLKINYEQQIKLNKVIRNFNNISESQIQRLTKELSFANDIKMVAIVTSFAFFILASIFIIITVRQAKKTMQPEKMTENIYDDPKYVEGAPVTTELPNTKSMSDNIKDDSYDQLNWSKGEGTSASKNAVQVGQPNSLYMEMTSKLGKSSHGLLPIRTN